MKRLVSVLRLLTIIGLWASLGGVALAQDSTPEAAADPTVFVRSDATNGAFLTDPDGKTLYLFTKDTEANVSTCEGDCLANWPAFTAEEPLTLPEGVDGELTSFDRGDGTMQVAYNGIPLYYFAADQNPGDIVGQGKGGVWFVVAPGAQLGDPQVDVLVSHSPELGSFLTDTAGMTLYLFTKDTEPNASVCEGDCLANWPPFVAEDPLTLPSGVDGELTSFDRGDGTMQVAYNGIPLYYFAGDANPGETNGQAVGDVWYVVAPGAEFGVTATPDAMMDATTIDVSLSEFTIMASQTEFKVGVEYTFNVTNDGEYQHEFVIEQAGANDEPLEADGNEAEIEPFDGGETNTLTWTFTEAGNYQFACHVMNHYSMGMAVTIHVTE
jgi:predicted lipoprotein with Yx(FWY)xxD motif